MRVVVLGAGVIGITTAYQLLKDGHEVTVIDRESAPASFTSFGNAGLIAPAHAYAWASPRAPAVMWRSLLRNDQAIVYKPSLDPRLWRWTWLFLKECTTERAKINTQNKARLSVYSQKMLQQVVAETGVSYDRGQGGLIYFYRSEQSFTAAASKADMLRAEGLKIEPLDRKAAIAKDPGLAAAADQIAGALYAPDDESGDCRLFTQALAEVCKAKGATIRMGVAVTGIEASGDEVTRILTSAGPLEADAYVVCLGLYAPDAVKKLGIRLPIYPVKGYSMTIPVTDPAAMPRIGGVDEDNLLAYCPMGERLRVTATAEIGGYSDAHKPGDFKVMLERTRKLFPKGADFDQASYWAGLRPMMPKGMPVIDRSPYSNLWLNCGHGHIGWTMSNGSARILADIMGQRQPAIAREGMRYEH